MHAGPTSGLWLARLGSGTAPSPLPTKTDGALPIFAADWRGDHVVFGGQAHRDGRLRRALHLLDIKTGENRTLLDTGGSEFFGTLSPDGRRLAYASDESGQWEVSVATFPKTGGRWRVSAGGGHQPRWNRDGSELFYIAPDRRMMSVRVRAARAASTGTRPCRCSRPRSPTSGRSAGAGATPSLPTAASWSSRAGRKAASPAVAIVNWKPDAAGATSP